MNVFMMGNLQVEIQRRLYDKFVRLLETVCTEPSATSIEISEGARCLV